MLRVGLTGELASGKSTVAKMLAAHGAVVLSSDEMARAMMQPGQPVFREIVERFGTEVLAADGTIDRRRLAETAFSADHPRVAELNAIVHPPVLETQAEQMAALAGTDAIVVVESALMLSVANWRERFDVIVVVTAPQQTKIARYVARAAQAYPGVDGGGLEADAVLRLAQQQVAPPAGCLLLENNGDVSHIEAQVTALWHKLLELKSRQ